jgi:hypothetical protein
VKEHGIEGREHGSEGKEHESESNEYGSEGKEYGSEGREHDSEGRCKRCEKCVFDKKTRNAGNLYILECQIVAQ